MLYATSNPDESELERKAFPYAVVITPDCDLEAHERKLKQGEEGLFSIAFLPFYEREAVSQGHWTTAKKNASSSWHVIEACTPEFDAQGLGLPSMLTSFPWIFTVPPRFLFAKIKASETVRRTQLCSPYRDHLQQRFAAHFGRVALEEPHKVD